jgi:Arc/MetJ family transcription regulator
MRMTVELEEDIVDELTKVTGIKKNSPAVAFAVRDFINRKKAKDFGRMLREGKFDYPATNEEIEARDI